MSHPIQFLDECFNANPAAIQTVYLGPKRFHLIFDHGLAEEILASKAAVFIQNRSIFDRIKPITGEKGLVQLNGVESKETRRMVRPMLSISNMDEMNKLIIKNTEEALNKLQSHSELDITIFMADLVLRNAFGMFLGIDIHEEASDIVAEYRELNELCGKRMLSLMAIPLFFPSKTNLRIKHLRESLRAKVRLALQNKTPTTINVHKIFQNNETLIDQCMTFLFAGHETTASSLVFTLLLMASHRQHQNEIDDDKALRIYKEALRLFPPAYMLAREVATQIEFHGVSMNQGDQVLIGVKQIHRHSKFHENAELFRPERFNQEVEAFLPFGLGAKNCIGEKLAYMEAVTIIKCFCHKFSFSTNVSSIDSYPLVTLHPGANQKIFIQEVIHGN